MISPTYVPAFSTRDNELRAYIKTDTLTKDHMLPLVTLRRDLESEAFEGPLAELLMAANGRPLLLDFDPVPRLDKTEEERKRHRDNKEARRLREGKPLRTPTKKQLEAYKRSRDAASIARDAYNARVARLLSPTDGYSDWREFSLAAPNVIPVANLGNLTEARKQVEAIGAAKRMVAFRVDLKSVETLDSMIHAAEALSQEGGVAVFDAGYVRNDPFSAVQKISDALERARTKISRSKFDALAVVCMASSFPSSLADMSSPLRIIEIDIISEVRKRGWSVTYGDHSSIQHREGNKPVRGWIPHVEVVHDGGWHYRRGEKNKEGKDYSKLAKGLVSDTSIWSGKANCWGSDMIERASKNILFDSDGKTITFPGPWITIRVNQHLTKQALLHRPS